MARHPNALELTQAIIKVIKRTLIFRAIFKLLSLDCAIVCAFLLDKSGGQRLLARHINGSPNSTGDEYHGFMPFLG